jgi:hypothetical protein
MHNDLASNLLYAIGCTISLSFFLTLPAADDCRAVPQAASYGVHRPPEFHKRLDGGRLYRRPRLVGNRDHARSERRSQALTEAALFQRCRKALELSQPAMTRALLIAQHRNIRRWEQGEQATSGPAWVALEGRLRSISSSTLR